MIARNNRALKEVSFLWLGSMLGAIAAFIIQVILARKFGPYDFGLFASAYSIVTLLAPLAGFGVAQFWLKSYGLEGWSALRWLDGSFQFIKISTTSVIGLIIIWIAFGPNELEIKIILSILSLYILGQVLLELVSAKFQLEEKFLALAIWQFSPHGLRLVTILFLILLTPEYMDLIGVSFIYSTVSIIYFIAGMFLLSSMKFGDFKLQGHDKIKPAACQADEPAIKKPVAIDVLSRSWPFGLATFFHLIYYQSDIILLKYLSGNEAAGIYNVAFTIMAAVYLLPGVIYQKYLLPKFHRWANHDREKFYKVYKFGSKLMIILGVGFLIAIWSSGFWAVPFLFGEKYADAVPVLNVLALSVPLIFVAFNSGATLVTRDNMRRKVKCMGYVAILNLILNLILIPFYGKLGAAIATVFSNLCLMLLYHFATKKHVFNKEF